MNEDKEVQEMEEMGRDLFKKFCATRLDFTILAESKKRWTSWDFAIMSADTKMIVELKYRVCNSNLYPDWILQEDKLNKLKEINKLAPDAKIIYCNIFTDSKIVFWDLSNLAGYQVKTEELTAKQYGPKYKVQKQIIKLEVKSSILFEPIN